MAWMPQSSRMRAVVVAFTVSALQPMRIFAGTGCGAMAFTMAVAARGSRGRARRGFRVGRGDAREQGAVAKERGTAVLAHDFAHRAAEVDVEKVGPLPV